MSKTAMTSPQRLRDFGGEAHEYVVTLTDRQACALRYIAHERVIRCRDCRFFEPEFVYEERHDDVHCSEFLCEPPGCKRFHSNHVEPDGFCSWAKPKEES